MLTSDWYKKFPPCGKASKLAVHLVCVVNDNAISKMEGADLLMAPALVDTELQEVREVLAEVIREHDDPMSDYGCTTHTCQRARDLMERLKP
jgi:hypothetical protein